MAVREKKRLGDLLVEAGAITQDQLMQVLKRQKSSGKKFGEAVVDLGFLTDHDILKTLASQLGTEVIELDDIEPDLSVLKKIPEATARKYSLMPLKKEGDKIAVAMSDPLNILAIDELTIKLGKEIKVYIAIEHQIRNAITRHYGITTSIQDALRSLKGTDMLLEETDNLKVTDMLAAPTELAPVAKLVDTIVRGAITDRASDIHIEPDEDSVMVRNRVDGMLFVAAVIPKKLQVALISRIKIISQMDIAETRIPQDGRFKLLHDDNEVEFRVSNFPTIHGENVVIRILNSDNTKADISETGLTGSSLDKALKLFKAPFGIIIVTGPTGSGKTTTLYSALEILNNTDTNIITVEDPVEYRLQGIRQSQVNVKAGLTFASSMRSILRQDPDVIMVGEIRDLETAEIAIQAAMTGHLVLTTLHTNDASSAVIRLADLGVDPFLISSGLVGIIAQRLVRTICDRCKTPVPKEDALAMIPNIGDRSIYKGEGCATCKKSGYTGRAGIFEVLMMDDALRSMISRGANAVEVKEYARKHQKMSTMREDGLDKMLKGLTTLDEVKRVTSDF